MGGNDQVLAQPNLEASEIVPTRQPARYLAVQNTGLLRHMRPHQIERHLTQEVIGEGLDYTVMHLII